MIGFTMFEVNALTRAVKAVPTTTAMDSSITLPRRMKSLNPLSMGNLRCALLGLHSTDRRYHFAGAAADPDEWIPMPLPRRSGVNSAVDASAAVVTLRLQRKAPDP